MKDDLIKRADAISACAYETFECYEARKAIRNLPSADRPQGEWIEMYRNGFGNMIYMCSKCNFHTTKSNYCPNCGTRMKGVDDDI